METSKQCECGMVLQVGGRSGTVNWYQHRAGSFHRHGQRVLALLSKECVTLAEIGKRLGITRERTRQIANQLGYTGRERMGECRIRKAERWADTDDLVGALKRDCPLHFNMILKSNSQQCFHWSKKTVDILGLKCRLFRIQWVESKQLYQVQVAGRHRYPECRFWLGKLGDGKGWMVLPKKMVVSTGFKLWGRRVERSEQHHDWVKFLNAWHLIKEAAR